MRAKQLRRSLISGLVAAGLVTRVRSRPGARGRRPNLALGKPATASGVNGPYTASNVTDGNADPTGRARTTPSRSGSRWTWAATSPSTRRTEAAPAGRLGHPHADHRPAGQHQRLELAPCPPGRPGLQPGDRQHGHHRLHRRHRPVRAGHITSNTGWPAGQLSELEIYGVAGPADPDRPGAPPTGTNLAAGKPMEASSSVFTFVAPNANDNNIGTYWESAGFPATLTARLGSNADVTGVVLKLNPDPAWGPRTQNIQVLGRAQGATGLHLAEGPGRLRLQPVHQPEHGDHPGHRPGRRPAVAGLQQHRRTGRAGRRDPGDRPWAPEPRPGRHRPDLDAGRAGRGHRGHRLGHRPQRGHRGRGGDHGQRQRRRPVAGTAAVGALAAGASTTVTVNAGRRAQGSYAVSAMVDPANTIPEQNDDNNSFTAPSQLVVGQAPGPDLQVLSVTSTPANPAVGAAVTFSSRSTTAAPARRGGHGHPGDGGQHHAEREHRGDRRRRHRQRDTSALDRHQRRRHDHRDRRRDRRGGGDQREQQRAYPVHRGRPRRGDAVRVLRGRGRPLPGHPGRGRRAAHLRAHQLRHRVLRPQVGTPDQHRPVRRVHLGQPGQLHRGPQLHPGRAGRRRQHGHDQPLRQRPVRAEADAVVAQQLAVRHDRRHRVAVELPPRRMPGGCSTSRTRCCPSRTRPAPASSCSATRRLGLVLRHRHDRPGAGGAGREPAGRLHLDHQLRRGAERRERRLGRHPAGGHRRRERRDRLRLDPGRSVASGAEDPVAGPGPRPVQPEGHPERR